MVCYTQHNQFPYPTRFSASKIRFSSSTAACAAPPITHTAIDIVEPCAKTGFEQMMAYTDVLPTRAHYAVATGAGPSSCALGFEELPDDAFPDS